MAMNWIPPFAALFVALFAGTARADEPRATGVDAGAYLGVGGPGYYAGIDAGIRHRVLEAGVVIEGATTLFGPSVSASGVYVGAGWDTERAVTLHAAGVIGTHTWRSVGSTGLFSSGPRGDTPYAGARLVAE